MYAAAQTTVKEHASIEVEYVSCTSSQYSLLTQGIATDHDGCMHMQFWQVSREAPYE